MTNDLKLIKKSLQRISDSHNQIYPKPHSSTPNACPAPFADPLGITHSSSEQNDLGHSMTDIHEISEAHEVSEISDITSRNFPTRRKLRENCNNFPIKKNPPPNLNRPQKVLNQRNPKMPYNHTRNPKQGLLSLNPAKSGQIVANLEGEIIDRAREQIKRVVARRPSVNSGLSQNSSRDKYFRRLITLEQTVGSGVGGGGSGNRDLSLNSAQKHGGLEDNRERGFEDLKKRIFSKHRSKLGKNLDGNDSVDQNLRVSRETDNSSNRGSVKCRAFGSVIKKNILGSKNNSIISLNLAPSDAPITKINSCKRQASVNIERARASNLDIQI